MGQLVHFKNETTEDKKCTALGAVTKQRLVKTKRTEKT
jgi:hypothetical protein